MIDNHLKSFDIKQNISLKEFSTFKIGGEAKYLTIVKNIEDMQKLVKVCFDTKFPFFVVGKGSNVLFGDGYFPGLIIVNKISFIDFCQDHFKVGSGTKLQKFSKIAFDMGFWGINFLADIPGTIGGAIYGNAGVKGSSIGDYIYFVDYIDIFGNFKRLDGDNLPFKYRFSPFKGMEAVITSAGFSLEKMKKLIDNVDYSTRRYEAQPLGHSLGCIFKNPENCPLSAGEIIENCGFKGERIGGAQVSKNHANFIVNVGNATAKDVLELIRKIQVTVESNMDILLELEIKYFPLGIKK